MRGGVVSEYKTISSQIVTYRRLGARRASRQSLEGRCNDRFHCVILLVRVLRCEPV